MTEEASKKKYNEYRKKYLMPSTRQVGGARTLTINCMELIIKSNTEKKVEVCEYPTFDITYDGTRWVDILDELLKKFDDKLNEIRPFDNNTPFWREHKIEKISVKIGNSKETINDLNTPIKYFIVTKLKIYIN